MLNHVATQVTHATEIHPAFNKQNRGHARTSQVADTRSKRRARRSFPDEPKLRFPSSRCSRLAPISALYEEPPSPGPLQFVVVCSLDPAPSSPKAFTHHLRLFVKCPAACYPAVLWFGAACVVLQGCPVCRDCPSMPLSGMLGKGGLAAVRDNLDLSPRQEASGATGSGSSHLATSKPWSDTSRNASAPNHVIRVCVERARLILVCFLSGFPCRHTTIRHRERSEPVTSVSW
ncbi:hypothetical protein HDV64DRAFT_221116 [Trichoderma sp. TUCIM 5745]